MTLEARSFGNRCLDHLVLDFHPRRHLATEPPLALFCRLRRPRRLVHAAWCAWLDIRAALQAFQPGDFFALFADNLFQFADLAEQFNQRSLELWSADSRKGRALRITPKESPGIEPEQAKNAAMPTFLSLLRLTGLA